MTVTETDVTQTKVANPGQYLTFILRNQIYAVPIGSVREINRMLEITEVPQSPEYVSGVINLRGKIIPVIDMRIKFELGFTEFTKNSCVIVMETMTGEAGMIADAVKGVVDLTATQIENRTTLSTIKTNSAVIGMAKTEEAVIILLDPSRLYHPEEMQKAA